MIMNGKSEGNRISLQIINPFNAAEVFGYRNVKVIKHNTNAAVNIFFTKSPDKIL